MSTRHRKHKARLAELYAERRRLSALAAAYELVRAHLKLTSAQSVAAAHDETKTAIKWIKEEIAAECSKGSLL